MNSKRLNFNPNSFKTLISALVFAFVIGPLAPLIAYADISSASVIGDTVNFANPGNFTWTVPSGITSVKVKVWGAGGAAGNGEKITDAHRSGLGGGAGGYSEKTFAVTAEEEFSIIVGAGGQGIKDVFNGRVGNEGTESRFEGSFGIVRALSGSGGTSYTGHGNPTNDLGVGGTAEGGDINSNGSNADPYIEYDSNPYASNGGSSPNGGAGGNRGRCGRDGTCPGSEPGSPLATDGGFPGGGGGGSDVGQGGYGANGQVTIEVVSLVSVTPPVIPPITPPIVPPVIPPIVPPVTPIDNKPIGYLDNVSCSLFNGWAYDPDNTSAQIGVHFYAGGRAGEGGTFIGNTVANVSRPDVNSRMGVTGNHGFSFTTPSSLHDNATHPIYAYGINSDGSTNLNNSLLTQSPLSITGCTSPITPPITPPVTPPTTPPVPPTVPPVTPVAVVPVSTGPTINSFSVTPPSVNRGDTVTFSGTASQDSASGSSCITKHRAIVEGSDTPPWLLVDNPERWSPVGCVSSLTLSSSPSTAVNPYSFKEGASEYTVKWDVQDANGRTTSKTQDVTVNLGGTGIIPSSPVINSFSVFPTSVTQGQNMIWTGTAVRRTNPIIQYRAYVVGSNVGAWTPATDPNSVSFTNSNVSTLTNPRSFWQGPGNYVARFEVQDSNGVITLSDIRLSVLAPSSATASNGGNGEGGGGSGGNGTNPLRDISLSLPSALTTSETGTAVTFTAVLTSVPTANVTLPITSSDFTEGTTSPITNLIFTPSNWNVPQTVTVTGVNDTTDDADVAYTILVGPSSSMDSNWNNIAVKAVSLINTDDDPTSNGAGSGGLTANINAVSTSVTTSSGGGGGGSRRHCTGFGCPVASVSTDIVPGDIWITLDNVKTSGSAVLGPEKVCPAGNFIKTFLRIGVDNNPDEVRKLQYFLNTYEKAGLMVNGDFDSATEEAVKAMQVKHTDEILAPWGVTEPTGIVYITTTRYMNTVYCKDNPEFKDNESIKDIPVNPDDFENVIGQTKNGFSNLALVIASLSGGVLQVIKDIHLYALLILLLLLLGTWFIIYGIVIKDIKPEERDASFMRGSALFCIGSVLDVLNTLSFMLNPAWFTEKTNLTLSWLLGLDLVNLLLVIVICLSALVVLYSRTSKV